MKKKSIILIGFLMLSFVFMASASANYNQTISKNQCEGNPSYAYDTVFEFTQTPRPSGDGTLTVSVRGDYNWIGAEDIYVIVEGTSLGQWFPGGRCSTVTKTYTVTKNQLVQWSADGKIEVTLEQDWDVNCDVCSNNINIVTLDYPTANNSLPMQQFMKMLGLGKKD